MELDESASFRRKQSAPIRFNHRRLCEQTMARNSFQAVDRVTSTGSPPTYYPERVFGDTLSRRYPRVSHFDGHDLDVQ